MVSSKQKIEELFQYYLTYGFDHTVDEIIEGLKISRKTFFNRYENKCASVDLCMQYWHEKVQERFRNKSLMCNHVVEELVLFCWEIHSLRQNESCFFKHDVETGHIFSEKAPFMSMMKNIILKGKRCYHFQEDIDIEFYSRYLINILAKMDFLENEHSQIMLYIFSPLLTERGMELLKEMEI